MGCIAYTNDGSGYNLNYNPETKKATTPYDLGSGLKCSNCYAYVGAGFHTILSYSIVNMSGIYRFTAKTSGNAGSNAELSLSVGSSRSGSQSYELLPA